MNQELIFTILYMVAFSVILATGEVLHHILKVRSEYTRKFAHSTASLLSLTFPVIFKSFEYVLVMGAVFFVVLFIARAKDLLKSIEDVSRKTYGSILLPIAISGAFVAASLLNDNKLFIIPILILGVSDTLAGITGVFFGKKLRQVIIYGWKLNKTYMGSLVFFLTALVICLYVLHWLTGLFSPKTLTVAFSVAFGAAIVELFSAKGFDNITVPLTTILILLMF